MYAQKKSIDNTHIVREKDRQRNRELLAVLSLGVPIGFFLLVFAWQNLEVIRLGRETTQLQKTLKEQGTIHKQLQAELDRMTSFDSVEKQVAKLGFEPAPPTAIVMVEKGVGDSRRRDDLQSVEQQTGGGGAAVDRLKPVAPQAVVPSSVVPQTSEGARPSNGAR